MGVIPFCSWTGAEIYGEKALPHYYCSKKRRRRGVFLQLQEEKQFVTMAIRRIYEITTPFFNLWFCVDKY